MATDETRPPAPADQGAEPREPEGAPDAAEAPIAPTGRRLDAPVYEMLWDCRFCGTRKLLGKTHRFCPNCGAPQDPDARYFPSDDEKVAVGDHVYYGADRVCPACGTANSAAASFCGQCGAPLTAAAEASRRASESRSAEGSFDAGALRDAGGERRAVPRQAAQQRVAGGSPGAVPVRWIAGVLVVLALAGCMLLYALTRTEPATVTVVDLAWSRSIDIERFGPTHLGAWCDEMPAGAYGVSRHQEVRYTQQVPDGQECEVARIDNGDGTYREETHCYTTYRSEPVYADRCEFTVDRWQHARTVEAHGAGADDEPRWPALGLARNAGSAGACVGCEREAGRHERYTVYFERAGERARLECAFDDIDEWRPFVPGDRWQLEVRKITGSPNCGSLRAVD